MNGWTNRETWLVNLWFNLTTIEDVQYAKEYLEEQYDNMDNGIFKDMLNLEAINWSELEEAMEDYED